MSPPVDICIVGGRRVDVSSVLFDERQYVYAQSHVYTDMLGWLCARPGCKGVFVLSGGSIHGKRCMCPVRRRIDVGARRAWLHVHGHFDDSKFKVYVAVFHKLVRHPM